jgi:hypothetical protein
MQLRRSSLTSGGISFQSPIDLKQPIYCASSSQTSPVKTGIARHPISDVPEGISGRLELMDAAGVDKILHHNAQAPLDFRH